MYSLEIEIGLDDVSSPSTISGSYHGPPTLTHVFFHTEIIASGRHPSILAVVVRPK